MTATITLPDGETVPALGQGTWLLGEDSSRRAALDRAYPPPRRKRPLEML